MKSLPHQIRYKRIERQALIDVNCPPIGPMAEIKEPAMLNFQSPSFLRRVFIADAVAGAATGALLAFGANALESLFGLPAVLLREAGIVLLLLAVLIAYIGTRAQLSRPWVWAIIVVNVLWVIDSIVLLLSGWVMPTALGHAFVIAQAVVVGLFAELEIIGVRKAPLAAA